MRWVALSFSSVAPPKEIDGRSIQWSDTLITVEYESAISPAKKVVVDSQTVVVLLHYLKYAPG